MARSDAEDVPVLGQVSARFSLDHYDKFEQQVQVEGDYVGKIGLLLESLRSGHISTL